VLITGVALALSRTGIARPARIGAAVLLLLAVGAGLFSIGMFYLPSLLALALSAILPAPPRAAATPMDTGPAVT
jgi:hypothetical protein